MKATIISIIIAAVLIVGAIFIVKSSVKGSDTTVVANNVSIVDGKQIIEIDVKGGYHPNKSVAKAGIPTVLRFKTSSTFDCSSAVRIPSMNISKNLPQTGTTDIDIGDQKVATLQGVCGMGMYPFEVNFQS